MGWSPPNDFLIVLHGGDEGEGNEKKDNENKY